MTNHSKLDSSCRIALAAFLHDLGKFAERARLSEAQEKDSEGNTQADKNKQLYCPHRKEFTDAKGYYTHVHAAYTAIAIDLLEDKFPPLKGNDVAPFASWRSSDTDDSLINAAAKHHTPDTFLQWIIATADRVASGFEREEFAKYNQAEEGTSTGKNHYTARQLTLMEQIDIRNDDDIQNKDKNYNKNNYHYRYALKPLSVESLFPVKATDYEHNDKSKAQAEYKALWDKFVKALDEIPDSHRKDLSLWLDHFETLWGHFAHAIPSATAFNAKPDVSLYDHSRTTAALATALWRYHDDRGDNADSAQKAMQDGTDWGDNKFLLIQGDFFGIQNFIFSSGGETNKQAAKLLRGRSFYISLLSECAALKILQTLGLPATSQIINAAGKFLIVAPNTEQTQEALEQVQTEISQWFLSHTWGQSGIGFAWEPACCNDFLKSKDKNECNSPFKKLIERLFDSLEHAKHQRFNLCGKQPTPPIFYNFLDEFDNNKGVCKIDGHSPASKHLKDDIYISPLAKDQISIGKYLANPKLSRLMISTQPVKGIKDQLSLDIFGFGVSFTQEAGTSGHFSPLLKERTLIRFWDFSLPSADKDECLWNGYAKRAINGFVPQLNETDIEEYKREKFGKLNKEDEKVFERFIQNQQDNIQIKNLNLIACEDRQLNEKGKWQGISALTTLKGDIDNLGMIFQQGLGATTFAKMAGLSRQINAFFTVYLPWLCQTEYENTYTVFAGGDDFFLIGPWQSQIKLAQKLQKAFKDYVAENEQVHFSVGLSTTKPGMPIRTLADMGEEALENAKAHNPKNLEIEPKNAVSCFSQVMSWDKFHQVMASSKRLQALSKDYNLSTGYTYGLLELLDMANEVETDPAKSIWHSYFSYRTMRMLESKKISSQEKKAALQILAHDIAEQGIETQRNNYRVALFNYLYQKRS